MASRCNYTKTEMIQALKNLYLRKGKVPTYIDVEKDQESPSVYKYKQIFGNWNKALEAAGFENVHRQKVYTKNDLMEAIHRFHKEFNRVPTEKLMNQTKGYPSGSVYAKMFGSWKEALAKAGFDIEKIYSSPTMDKVKRYDNETLLKFLRDFKVNYQELPVPLNWFKLENKPRREIYIRRFGSWKKALLAAGFDAEEVAKLNL